jgi:hypothetical protein
MEVPYNTGKVEIGKYYNVTNFINWQDIENNKEDRVSKENNNV